MEINKKLYLGDSVYATFDGYHIVLTTENGDGASNTIALEPSVMDALFGLQKRITNHYKEGESLS